MAKFDDPTVFFDAEDVVFDEPEEGEVTGIPPHLWPNLAKGMTSMENWEITKQRAQITLSIWNLHTPTLKIGGVGPEDREAATDGRKGATKDWEAAPDGR